MKNATHVRMMIILNDSLILTKLVVSAVDYRVECIIK